MESTAGKILWLVIISTLTLGCGQTPVEKAVARAQRAQETAKQKASTKKQSQRYGPPSGGLWDGPPQRDAKRLTPEQKAIRNGVVDPWEQDLVDRGVAVPAGEDGKGAKFRYRPVEDKTRAPHELTSSDLSAKKKTWTGFTAAPWPRPFRPSGGRFGKVKLPSGDVFNDLSTVFTKEQLDELFPRHGGQNNRGPVYAEYYPDKKLALALTLDPAKAQLEGPAVSLFEGGLPASIGFYSDGDLEGPLRVYDETGALVLYGEFKNGRRQGIWALFTNGWPTVIQIWKGGLCSARLLTLGDTAIDLNDVNHEGAVWAAELAHAELDDRVSKALADEKKVRVAVVKSHGEQLKDKRKQQGKINGIRNRNNLVAVMARDNAAANAAMQQAWQGAVNQASAAMKTLGENPAGYLGK